MGNWVEKRSWGNKGASVQRKGVKRLNAPMAKESKGALRLVSEATMKGRSGKCEFL